MSRVLVVGSLNLDYHLTVEREPADDGTARVSRFSMSGGGHAGNCAAALARLGCETSLFSAIGDDPEGELLLAELAGEGVVLDHVVRVKGAETGRVFIPAFPDRRFMLMFRGATDGWTAADCAAVDLDSWDAVVLFDPPEDVARDVLRRSAGAGVPVYWNPGGLHSDADWVLEAVSEAEWLSVNRPEFEALFGCPPDAASIREASRRHRVPWLVVTLGAEGAMASDGTRVWSVPAHAVDVVDATGAGDAFAAGFVTGGLLGRAWPEPLALAVAAGAHAVTVPGARAASLSPGRLADMNSGGVAPTVYPHSQIGM
ncbi:carbohydrate kinase family protein [Streptomyces wedmorensis]|uniref:carbohydrate kinase family protein n=1 Tax=Streptomyces wedmorensis TaxID=43759 RepID=UPI003438CC68